MISDSCNFQDSTGHIGFQFKEGRITSLAVDSSAARNGLLIDHNLLEVNDVNKECISATVVLQVNGQNVVGIRDKDIGSIIEAGGEVITVTVIPSHIYSHIMKNMSSSMIKRLMDHSVPDA